MADSVPIRVATIDDAAAVQQIYAPFCEASAITFEEEPPTVSEIERRIESTLETYPWLVYEETTQADSPTVVGYAYADSLRKREAYQWVVELSVYVKEGYRSTGIGTALYTKLLRLLEQQGIRDAYAVTTLPNQATVEFHDRLGFERLVDFPKMGYTEGKWHDVAWWRYEINPKCDEPEPIIPFADLRANGIDS